MGRVRRLAINRRGVRRLAKNGRGVRRLAKGGAAISKWWVRRIAVPGTERLPVDKISGTRTAKLIRRVQNTLKFSL